MVDQISEKTYRISDPVTHGKNKNILIGFGKEMYFLELEIHLKRMNCLSFVFYYIYNVSDLCVKA